MYCAVPHDILCLTSAQLLAELNALIDRSEIPRRFKHVINFNIEWTEDSCVWKPIGIKEDGTEVKLRSQFDEFEIPEKYFAVAAKQRPW
jgi:hypothetical protein